MKRTGFLLALAGMLLPSLASGAVIDQVTGTSVTPTMLDVTGVALGETPGTGGTGLSITVSATVTDINDDRFPNDSAVITYRVGNQIPPGGTPDPGMATYTVNINNTDAGGTPLDAFRDFILSIPSNYGPGVAFSAPTAPVGWVTTLSTANEIRFFNNTGFSGAGLYAFGFMLSIPNPDGISGNTFQLRLTARNPEPGSMALAAVAMSMLGGGAAHRRRKKKKAAEEASEANAEA